MTTMTVSAVLATLANVKGVKFGSFTYRAKGTGELAKHSIILGASIEKLYEKDVAALDAMLPNLSGIELEAAVAIRASRIESLTEGIGNNSAYTNADTYLHLAEVPGVKVHKDSGELHVSGLVQHKTVLEKGTYRTIKSAPLTIAKDAIRAALPSSKFRQFKLGNLTRLAANGEVLEAEAE